MIRLLLRLLTTKALMGLGLLAAVFWQAYDILTPKQNDADLLRHAVAQVVIQKAVEQMPREYPVRQMAIAELVGDRTGYIKQSLADELRKSDKFGIVTDTYVQNILKEVMTVAKKSGLVSRRLVEELEGGGITSLEAAIELANRIGVATVLFGEVKEFSTGPEGVRLEMYLRIADAQTGKALFGGAFAQESNRSNLFSPYLSVRIKSASLGVRIFTWIVFTTLFPLIFGYVLMRYFRQESNVINLLILVGLTLIDTLLALALMGFSPASFPQQSLLLLAFIVGLAYNYLACSHLERASQ